MNIINWYELTERKRERELRRRLQRRDIKELIEALVLVGLGIAILLFFVYATPPQPSAINDLEEDSGAEAGK